MIEVNLDGTPQAIATTEAFHRTLDHLETEPRFELWLSVPDGPSICMLREEAHAWLMYLRFEGDSGFVSTGDAHLDGTARFTLGNGQVDEYQLSWCIGWAACHAALRLFFANEGRRPDAVTWRES